MQLWVGNNNWNISKQCSKVPRFIRNACAALHSLHCFISASMKLDGVTYFVHEITDWTFSVLSHAFISHEPEHSFLAIATQYLWLDGVTLLYREWERLDSHILYFFIFYHVILRHIISRYRPSSFNILFSITIHYIRLPYIMMNPINCIVFSYLL